MEEHTLSLIDILHEICGEDAIGYSKCYMTIYHEMIDCEGNVETIDTFQSDKPIINIFAANGYVMLDCIYKSSRDEDLIAQWDFLSNYYNPENSESAATKSTPSMVIVVIPKAHEEEYCMMAANPLFHTLLPKDPKNPEPCVVKLVFDEDNVDFYRIKEGDINKREIEDEILHESNVEID